MVEMEYLDLLYDIEELMEIYKKESLNIIFLDKSFSISLVKKVLKRILEDLYVGSLFKSK